MKIRPCTLAGAFYPAEPERLKEILLRFFDKIPKDYGENTDPMGIVSPHAGYFFSGQAMAVAYGAVDKDFSGTFIIIGPSHRGLSSCISECDWETPIGVLKNDRRLTDLIDLPVDERSMNFGNENSIEVQMPFIRNRFPHAGIVPVMMGRQTPDEIKNLSEKISSALIKYDGNVKIVASSDFSHYIPAKKAETDDRYAISALTEFFDTGKFYSRIMSGRMSVCGYGPISTMIETLKNFGASKCSLLTYQTSGETSGNYSQVVGYAALAVK